MSGRRDDLDSVHVDMAAAERHVDMGVLADLEQLGDGRMQ